MSLMNPARVIATLEAAVEDMIGRGDMSPEEMQVSCVVSAMAELLRADALPDGIVATRQAIAAEINRTYRANAPNWDDGATGGDSE